MKVSQVAFRAAIAPVLADLDHDRPGLLRVDETPLDDDCHAWLRDGSGFGTGVYLSDALSPDEAVAEVADVVQEAAIEALHGAWPSCPRHPDSHPLTAAMSRGEASWLCGRDGSFIAKIGQLARAYVQLSGRKARRFR
ncbi:MAG: hypothetical protein ACRDWY_07370 [Actinomycetes bacterium]